MTIDIRNIKAYVINLDKNIEKYKKIIQTPVKVSFFNGSSNCKKTDNLEDFSDNKKYEILDEFYDIAKKYIQIKSYKKETQQKYICHCGNQNNYTETQNKIICNR